MALPFSKKLPPLLGGVTSKHHGDFFAFILLQQKTNLNLVKKYVKIKIFVTLQCFLKTLKYQNLINIKKLKDKAPFIIYADLECLIEKIDRYKNNSKNSFTAKVSKHIPSGFSMSTKSSSKNLENKHGVSRGKDCIIKVCESFREKAMKIIKFKKKK